MNNMKIIIFFVAASLLAGCQSFLLGDLPPQQKLEEERIAKPLRSASSRAVDKSIVIRSRNDEPEKKFTGDEKAIPSDEAANLESEDTNFQRDALDELGDFFSQLFSKKVNDPSLTVSGGVEEGSKSRQSNSADENSLVRGKVERRYSAAYGVYYPLAKKGHAFAQYEMALMHLHGYGVNSDLKKAESWFRKAASQGHPDAKTELRRLISGEKKAPNKLTSTALRKPSVEAPSTLVISSGSVKTIKAVAENNTGSTYESTPQQNEVPSVSYDQEKGLRKKIDWGSVTPGSNAIDSESTDKKTSQGYGDGAIPNFSSIRRVKPSTPSSSTKKVIDSENKIVDSTNQLAKTKDNGISKTNFPKKLTPTKTSIKENDPIQDTELNLAKLVPENDAGGTIVEQDNASFSQGLLAYKKGDFKTSFSHWYPLAQRGNAESQNRLGFLYENGKGVKLNYKKAVEWYLKAAEKGEPAAQFNLGVMYRKGRGVQKNDKIARNWYEKAAKQGHPIAERVVEVMRAYKIGE
ncbi:MAG: hypothetical protein VX941_00270 [Pseudomonadota bacterium]|nr:hypothetical protein [Pseudomonadota bacterium]